VIFREIDDIEDKIDGLWKRIGKKNKGNWNKLKKYEAT